MSKRMTKTEAIKKLTETRTLSTDLLKPLGLPFESWLRLSQLQKKVSEKVVDDLINYYNSTPQEQRQIVQALRRRAR